MNKKTALGAAVALAVVAYGGATWYLGQRAQASYQEALEEVRKVLGAETVVSQDYQKGFFTSQAKVVLQWTPPASADASEPAPQPLRVVVNSAVRHGPLAGGALAAAVVESRFALEGLDAKAGTLLAKAQAPTLTTVHGLTGSHHMKLIVPAGELGDEEVTMRWQEMKTEFSVSGDRTQVKGNFQWPELAFSGVKKASDEEDAQDEAPSRFAMSFKGMNGDFESQIIDDLWMMAPGKGSIRFAQVDASNTPQGGTASTLLALKDLLGTTTIERNGKLLSMASSLKGKGLVGPVDFESIGFEEKFQRIDADVVKTLQVAMVESYRKDGLKAMASEEDSGKLFGLLADNAQRLAAALPAYSMKFVATLGGQQGEVSYGGEITRAPSAEEVTQAGWGPVLLKNATFHADVRLPKAWLPQLAKAAGQEEFKSEDVDGMIGMAQAAGYVRQEGDNLTSSLKMEGGQAKLNGRVMDLPNFMR